MRKMVSTILRQHGTEMTLHREGEMVNVRGFFQPFRSKSWQSLVEQEPPDVYRRQYVYIGPADVAAFEGDILMVGEKRYCLRRVELYRYGDEPVYTWGVCVENREVQDSDSTKDPLE